MCHDGAPPCAPGGLVIDPRLYNMSTSGIARIMASHPGVNTFCSGPNRQLEEGNTESLRDAPTGGPHPRVPDRGLRTYALKIEMLST